MLEKVHDFVDFPTEGLDLREYVEDIRIKDSPDPFLYDLYAVINHDGNLHGGINSAYCYN
jgi:ubiquitin carboxyl-terminal hydrolase 4/11